MNKKLIVGILLFYTIVLCSILFFTAHDWFLNLNNDDAINVREISIPGTSSGSQGDLPISRDNLLIYSIRINNISSSLNKAIKKANLDLPEVKFHNSDLSYKVPGRSWILVDNDLILVFLYRDVADLLNTNEVMAVAVHELGHIVLGHAEFNPLETRNIDEEIAADNFAVDSGIDSNFLASAINKLASDGEEKERRIKSLLSSQTITP